jgi:hypothetical protein
MMTCGLGEWGIMYGLFKSDMFWVVVVLVFTANGMR